MVKHPNKHLPWFLLLRTYPRENQGNIRRYLSGSCSIFHDETIVMIWHGAWREKDGTNGSGAGFWPAGIAKLQDKTKLVLCHTSNDSHLPNFFSSRSDRKHVLEVELFIEFCETFALRPLKRPCSKSFGTQSCPRLSRPRMHMGVSINGGTSKSSILVGVSHINHLFWGTPVTVETPILQNT